MAQQKAGASYLEPFHTASDEMKRIIKRILQTEKDKLYLDRPRVLDDIVAIIKEEIQ